MTLRIFFLYKFHINSLVNWYFSRIYRIFNAAHKMIEMCMKLSVVASNYNLFERREIFVFMYGLYIFGSWSLFYTQLHMCHTDFRCIIIRIKTRDGELHHNISTHDYPPIWCVDMDLIHRFGKKESFFFVDIQNCVNFTICSFCH